MKIMNWVVLVLLLFGGYGNMISGANFFGIQNISSAFLVAILISGPVLALGALDTPIRRLRLTAIVANFIAGGILLMGAVIGAVIVESLLVFSMLLFSSPYVINYWYLKNEKILMLPEEKPPTGVLDVFDGQIIDKEIAANRNSDWTEEKKKFEEAFEIRQERKLSFKQRLSSLSRSTRMFIAGSVTWFVWVVFRTYSDWEILGIDLDYWDEDMFFANVALPILAVWLAFKIYRWVASGSK